MNQPQGENNTAHANQQPGVPWLTEGVRFYWFPQEAFERIEQRLERGDALSAKAVYVALCIIANRERLSSVTKPINYLAQLASLNRRTVERRLPDLERLGLIAIHRGNRGECSTYIVATLSRNPTTLSRQGATARRAPTVALLSRSEEDQKGHSAYDKEAASPLTTGLRIGLEKQCSELEDRIRWLEDNTYYKHDRVEHPERVTELNEKREKLEVIKRRLAL